MKSLKRYSLLIPVFLLGACSAASTAEQTQSETSQPAPTAEVNAPDISTETIAEGFAVLKGPGGNIGVSLGDDGVFVIDDKFARFSDQIIARIAELTDAEIKFVVNTHYHGDHTGANAEMRETGATIVAHDNVRARMGMRFENRAFGRVTEPTDPALWPNLTFSENATFHFNGHTVKVIHVPSAHTDGDAFVYFEEANILHMGDNFFHGMFPFVDVDGGGSVQGMIDAHSVALGLSDENTKIIPGHGPMATVDDLRKAQDILKTVQSRVQAGIDAGNDADKMVADGILSDMSEYDGFMKQEHMIRISHRSITGE